MCALIMVGPDWWLKDAIDRVSQYVMRCAVWYHLYNLKNLKNTYGGVFLLVKLQAEACN